MAEVVHISASQRIVDKKGLPTNPFYRFLVQIRTVVTSFSDLDGTANDISEGDVNRFREIADLAVTRDGNGFVSTVAQNGKTKTISRDGNNLITQVVEVVDAEPTKVTTQVITRDAQDFLEGIDVSVLGFEL